jgi:pyrophosphate--fructose-6-phosphate 1-phosphotransferase
VLTEQDSHGNLKLSQVETEKLLVELVERRVKQLDETVKFQAVTHFFGYEGRCGIPTLFDNSYSYQLGLIAASLVLSGKTGYMACQQPGGKPHALPLIGLMSFNDRKKEMVIEKALVDLNAPAFKLLDKSRKKWLEDDYRMPGPIQFFGPTANQFPVSIALNQKLIKG